MESPTRRSNLDGCHEGPGDICLACRRLPGGHIKPPKRPGGDEMRGYDV